MIKIKVITVGKDKDRWVSNGAAHYIKLLSRFAKLEVKTIPVLKASSSFSKQEIKKKEGVLITSQLSTGTIVALTDKGQKMDSITFAKWLNKLLLQSKGQITFIIGGAYGLDPKIINQADFVVSLSSLTFSHQLARLILFEQLFRAFSIINGGDYHK